MFPERQNRAGALWTQNELQARIVSESTHNRVNDNAPDLIQIVHPTFLHLTVPSISLPSESMCHPLSAELATTISFAHVYKRQGRTHCICPSRTAPSGAYHVCSLVVRAQNGPYIQTVAFGAAHLAHTKVPCLLCITRRPPFVDVLLCLKRLHERGGAEACLRSDRDARRRWMVTRGRGDAW